MDRFQFGIVRGETFFYSRKGMRTFYPTNKERRTNTPWPFLVAIILAFACLPSAAAPSPEIGFETGGAIETPLAPDGPWTRKMLALIDLSWETAPGWSVDCEGALADDAHGQSIPTSAILRRLGDAMADEGLAAAIETACAIHDSRIAEMAGLGEPVSIDDVEDLLEDLEACLDDLIDELEMTDPGERRAELAALAAAVGMAEDVMDGLEYLASRIRLYAADSIQSELARRVRDATLRGRRRRRGRLSRWHGSDCSIGPPSFPATPSIRMRRTRSGRAAIG